MEVSLIVGVLQNEVVMNARGDRRQCLMSRNQIDIRTDLIGVAVVEFAGYPKATNEEFTLMTVVCDGISVAQIDQEARYLVGFL